MERRDYVLNYYEKYLNNPVVVALDKATEDEAIGLIKTLGRNVGAYQLGWPLLLREGIKLIERITVETQCPSVPLFLDLQLMGTPDSASRVITSFAPYLFSNIRYIVINGAAGENTILAAMDAARNKRKILVGSALSSLSEDQVRDIYNESPDRVTLSFARLAHRIGAGGITCSVRDLEYLRRNFKQIFETESRLGLKEFIVATYGIRPEWYPDKGTHEVVMTPQEAAVQNGADLLIIGSPIRNAKNPRAALRKILKEIGKDLPPDAWW